MVDSTNNNKGGVPTCQKTKDDMEDDRRDSIHKRNKIIKTCLGIGIWILVCVPSNIVATIFYFKQNDGSPGPMHSDPNLLTNVNVTTHGIYEHDRKPEDGKQNNSMEIHNQVSLIRKLQQSIKIAIT